MRSRRSTVSGVSANDETAVSPIQTSPSLGVSRAAIRCIRVDLPDPDGPMIAVNSPESMSKSTWSSAVTVAEPEP